MYIILIIPKTLKYFNIYFTKHWITFPWSSLWLLVSVDHNLSHRNKLVFCRISQIKLRKKWFGNTIGSTVDLFPHMAVNLICQIRWLISYARSDGWSHMPDQMAHTSRLYNSSGVPDLSGTPDMVHTTERPRLNSKS